MDMRKLLEAVTKFAGEPEQKPGEQWKGTDSAPPGKKLVGDSIIKDLAKGPTPKTKEQELAEAYAKFLEDNIGVEPKRPARKGSRHARGHEPKSGYKTVKEYKKDTDNFTADDIKELEGIKDLATLKDRAFQLISTPSKKPMKPEKVAWFKSSIERMTNPTAVIKLMWDLLLSGEGQAVIGSRSSMNPNSYRSRFNEGWGRGNDRVTIPDDSTLYWSGNGPLQQEYDALYNELVPSQGKADTIEGEVLRAASKIVYRHYNDGDEFNQASFEQLVPYIGAVTSYDDLAHKATEFAIKANGNYTPNPNWDSLDVMEYGPEEDDYDDYEEDDSDWYDDEEEDEDEDEDEDLDESVEELNINSLKNGDVVDIVYVKNPKNQDAFSTYDAQIVQIKNNKIYFKDPQHPDSLLSRVISDFDNNFKIYKKTIDEGINWPKEVPSDASQEQDDEDEPHPYGHDLDEARTTWNSDWYVYNPETLAVKKKFRTYKGAKQYAEANGLKLAASEWYHDKINTQKQTDEGWESGPKERSSRERDPDAEYDDMRQQKADAEAERQQAKRPQEQYYTLTGRGPNMEPNYAFPGEYASQDEAAAARARLMADPKTPNPRMIGISKRTRYLDESEEEQIFTLVSDAGKRTIQGTPTRAKKIVRSLMMQQQLGDKFKLIDGEGSVVLSHGYAKSNTPAKPGSVHTTNTPVAHGAEVAKPELDPEGEYYSLNDIYDYVLNPPEEDDEEYRPREKDVTPDVRRVAEGTERKFPAPRPATPEEIKRGGPSNKSLMMKNGMIYHHQDPRAHQVKEGIESADPVEGAVLAAVQELIQQGHTEVAPEVITNMVVAATSQPFLLKDLVDANNNSPAVQHYIDSINPTKVKFSNEILTVKNEDPLKDKKQAQAGVANMAARAAGRNRLGENSVTPLKDKEDLTAKQQALSDLEQYPELSADVGQRKQVLAKQAQAKGIKEGKVVPVITAFRKGMEKIAASDMNPQAKQAAFDRLSAEFHKNAEAYSQAVKAKRKTNEADSAIGGGAIGSTAKGGAVGGGAIGSTAKGGAIGQNVAAALNTFKSATGSNAPAPNIAKALDAVTQGEPVGGAEMKVLEPVMKDLATVATDPKLASQFKSLAGQVNQTQAKQQQQQ